MRQLEGTWTYALWFVMIELSWYMDEAIVVVELVL